MFYDQIEEVTPEQARAEEAYYRLCLWASLAIVEDEYRARTARIEEELCELTCGGEAGRGGLGCPVHMTEALDRSGQEAIFP